MATTTYDVIAINAEGESVFTTVTKKQTAVDAAKELRNDEGVAVRVVTSSGKVVFEQAAPKKIKMSPAYTRVVAVPSEVVETINGQRVAYKRARLGFALLDANVTGQPNGTYTAWDLKRSEAVEDLEPMTTRDFGRWCADEGAAYRAAHPAPANA